MLKELKPLDDYIGVDCRHKSVLNVLKFKELYNFEYVWKQSGIFYNKYSQNEPGIIKGKYMKLQDELEMINNIHASSFKTKSKKELLHGLKATLSLQEPIILYVDTFNFVKNPYYQNKKMLHTITLTNYENGKFSYVDDTFFDTNQLSEEELVEAAWVTRADEGMYYYLTISILEAYLNLGIKDYLYVIDKNTRYMVGRLSEAEKSELQLRQSTIKRYPTTVVGIEAINNFISDYNELLQREDVIPDKIYNMTYLTMMELSNCHFRYAEFLKPGIDLEEVFMELVELLQDAAQDWKISSNMMIKAMYKKDNSMFHRMLGKVKKTIPKEQKIIELSDSLLSKYHNVSFK